MLSSYFILFPSHIFVQLPTSSLMVPAVYRLCRWLKLKASLALWAPGPSHPHRNPGERRPLAAWSPCQGRGSLGDPASSDPASSGWSSQLGSSQLGSSRAPVMTVLRWGDGREPSYFDGRDFILSTHHFDKPKFMLKSRIGKIIVCGLIGVFILHREALIII